MAVAVFSPDGRRVLTASEDDTARLWEADGKLVAALKEHTGSVESAVFSPDGVRILTASDDETARLWNAFPNPQKLADRVKAEVPRCLTPEPPRWCITMQKWPYDPATLAAQKEATAR